MKPFLQSVLLLSVLAVACMASDESLKRGVPGTYARTLGMFSERVVLKADGSYVFTTFYCVSAEVDGGSWSVRDTAVILTPTSEGDPKAHPTRFLVLAVEGDLALQVQDEAASSDEEVESRLLFLPEKPEANQPPEPTSGLRPAAAHL